MSRQSAPADPLADLRQSDEGNVTTQQPAGAPSATPEAPTAADAATDPQEPASEPEQIATDAAWHQEAASSIVDRWHADDVARLQMHGGGTCGCRYAAAMALVLLYGPPVPTVEAEPEDAPPAGDQS